MDICLCGATKINGVCDEPDCVASSPIRFVCTKCGSDKVSSDASARWNTTTQSWELSGVQDQKYCENCGGECDADEVLIGFERVFDNGESEEL